MHARFDLQNFYVYMYSLSLATLRKKLTAFGISHFLYFVYFGQAYREKMLYEMVKPLGKISSLTLRRVRYDDVEVVGDTSDKSTSVIYKDAFNRRRIPITPALSVDFIDVASDRTFTYGGNSLRVTSTSRKYLIYENTLSDLSGLVQAALISWKSSKACFDGCDRDTVSLKIGSIGTNSTLHKLVCSYVALQDEGIPDLSKVNFQTYIIPLGVNTTAEYLALLDPW
jgi:hypothetical protein